ncbi:MAG TPA: ATP-binding protein [Homoserinimonas sp.]|nr:ATP-binding protein [Homoserinimonas sp.]
MSVRGLARSAARQPRPARRPISRALIEIVASRSVAFFGLAFGAQTVPVALDQWEYANNTWFLIVGVGLFGGLVLAVIASIAKRWVRTANAFVLITFLLALISWPIGLEGEQWTIIDRPWLWFLITVATAAAAIALPVWMATFYLLLAPILYGIIRASSSGGSVHPALVSLDVIYAVILGGAVLIIVTMLRGAAAAVDAAQATALGRYVDAVREHATEVERVQVDSIVHDSVLTTLLSAAKAQEADSKAMAARMARNAIGHLQSETATPTADVGDVSASALAERIGLAASTLSSIIDVRTSTIGHNVVPASAAEALYSASLQAMVNSLQHAGDADGVTHWVRVSSLAAGGVLIEVGDTGRGFSMDEIPVERLGLRVSIIDRVSNAGGAVDVDSVEGEGTAIRLFWPAPSAERRIRAAQELGGSS